MDNICGHLRSCEHEHAEDNITASAPSIGVSSAYKVLDIVLDTIGYDAFFESKVQLSVDRNLSAIRLLKDTILSTLETVDRFASSLNFRTRQSQTSPLLKVMKSLVLRSLKPTRKENPSQSAIVTSCGQSSSKLLVDAAILSLRDFYEHTKRQIFETEPAFASSLATTTTEVAESSRHFFYHESQVKDEDFDEDEEDEEQEQGQERNAAGLGDDYCLCYTTNTNGARRFHFHFQNV